MGPRPEGHLETLAKLVAAGADVAAADKTGSTPLHRAASQGRVKIVAALLDGSLPGGATCDVEARNGVRQTPLLVACEVRSPYTGPHTTASAW
jgi:ankyrin repeat protein